MKSIIVATDFSECSKNAAEYAARIAKEENARLTILHIYSIPVMASEGQVVLYSIDELSEIYDVRVKEETEKLRNKFQIEVEGIAVAGFASDEIISQIKERKSDLLVMGIQGTNTLAEVIIGSTTASVARKSPIPVLVVPEEARYRKPSNLVIASDLKETGNEHTYELVKEISKLFKARIHIVNIKSTDELVSVDEAVQGLKVNHFLEGVDHDFYFLKDEDFEHGIEEFIKKVSAEILVMVPHKHSLLMRIINRPHTQKMIFHTHIPMLCLPAYG